MPGIAVGTVGSGTAVVSGIGPRSTPRSPPWPRNVAKIKVIGFANIKTKTAFYHLYLDLKINLCFTIQKNLKNNLVGHSSCTGFVKSLLRPL